MFVLYSFVLSIITFFNAVACDYCDGHDCMETRAHVRELGGGASGKWVDDATPKRGWKCAAIEDLGAPTAQCEMCEREEIRYVHTMKHGRFDALNVGCICAAYMDGFLDTEKAVKSSVEKAKKRQQTLENRDTRRRNFPHLAGWKVSTKGNDYINYKVDGEKVNVTMIKSRYGHYSAMVGGERIEKWFGTIIEAQLAAFDFMYPSQISFGSAEPAAIKRRLF